MKSSWEDYVKIIMYTIFSILFAVSTYIIILNIHHTKSLSDTVNVSDIDDNYNKYKDNVNLIDDKLNNYHDKTNKEYLTLSKVLNIMKKDGLFRLVPKTKLSYKDLYNLNDYFIEELINNGWVHNLNELEISKSYQNTFNMLANNSKYINSIFVNNSLKLSDNGLSNEISDNYHFILNNYLMYSEVILNIVNELGGGSG